MAIPRLQLHKATNRSRLRLDGRDFYHPEPPTSKAAQQWYARLIGEYAANGNRVVPRGQPITVAELVDQFLRSDEGYDQRDTRVVNTLVRLYGDLPASQFGPSCLKAVRQTFVDGGGIAPKSKKTYKPCNRVECNRMASRVRRVFRWGVAEELIDVTVAQALSTVSPLRYGKTSAREPEPVRPVSEKVFRASLPHLSNVLRAVAELQWWTGARAGEILIMRPADVDTSADVWEYRPQKWKGKRLGGVKVIYLGPNAQRVLRPWLDRHPEDNCFRPQEAHDPAGELYTTVVYGRAIERACKKAKVTHWHSHQLRHAAATRLRATHGLETAKSVLGHTRTDMTEIYAERDMTAAAKAMREAG